MGPRPPRTLPSVGIGERISTAPIPVGSWTAIYRTGAAVRVGDRSGTSRRLPADPPPGSPPGGPKRPESRPDPHLRRPDARREPTSPNQNPGSAIQRSSTMWPFTRMMMTRTRPKTLSASRRKRRPGLECLEQKNLLTTVFGSYPDGTWAFNDQAGWRHLNTSIPLAMKEGADGTLFVSYKGGTTPGPGTFRYDFGSNTWTELTGLTTHTLSAST